MNGTGTCECNCGERTTLVRPGVWRRFVRGHNRRGKGSGWIENGYRYISVNGRKIGEHRWVVEQREGRKLTSREHVHHVNGDELENRSENLIVLSVAEHARLRCGMKWKRWSSEEIARARELKAAGLSVQDVAKAMGRGISSTTRHVCNRRTPPGQTCDDEVSASRAEDGGGPRTCAPTCSSSTPK